MKSRAVVVGRFPDYTVREFEVPACGAEGLIVKGAAATLTISPSAPQAGTSNSRTV